MLTPVIDLQSERLHQVLRKYWGYSEFRPLQERIVRSVIAGRDVAVVMPTGGGKSLCYQLPALFLGKTAIVVSPLIALMQDQATQLAEMGISAAVVNSTQPQREQWDIIRAAQQGRYRLLYLSPERLAREDTCDWLKQVPLAMFAIDEAHCISEWGHEFRPEYRMLNTLRANFPDVPIAAFTASATKLVRQDIITQLRLQEPDKYIRSFHRPNLRYLVKECDEKSQPKFLLNALAAHEGENAIVYCPTIAKVEETVDFLADNKIAAIAYHGKMSNDIRRQNQNLWMADKIPVLVGTLAFGLGINKPTVRAVIHMALPKSVEQYYQEAGRAGRDGEPSDCLMLWQPRDAGLLAYFVEQLTDINEKKRAWQRYHSIRDFAESHKCRHLQICNHFGETPKWTSCSMCDVCAQLPEWLTAKRAKKAKVKTGSDDLREFLRQWRNETALRERVPPYIVLTDASLEDLCKRKPRSLAELLRVTGFGESKAAKYGAAIFGALERFDRGARAVVMQTEVKVSPKEETLRLIDAGRTFAEIADERGRAVRTVVHRHSVASEPSALVESSA